VLVQPDAGSWHAVTAAGGGYAIPVEQPGTYRLTISGPGLATSVQQSVSVQGTSALADVLVAGSSAPLELDIRRVPGSAMLLLEWTGGSPPYQLKTARDLRQGAWQNLGAPTNATSTSVPFDGPFKYFRIFGS
jgi:hypothetical protein